MAGSTLNNPIVCPTNGGYTSVKDGAELYQKVKKADVTAAWVWWEICKRKWQEGSSLTVIREVFEHATKAFSSSRDRRADKIPSDRTAECRFRRGIKVDGNLDEWAGLPVYRGKNVIRGESPTPGIRDEADLSYTFQTAWDATYVYFAFDVRDDIVRNSQTGANLWRGDSVEIWIGALNIRSNTRQEGDFQYVFGVNNLSYAISNAIPITTSANSVVQRKPGGYTMEIAIPLAEVMLSHIRKDYTIGFEVGVDDADESPDRDAQLLTFAKSESVWCDPSLWGNLRFAVKR